jgi:hypothetical protein
MKVNMLPCTIDALPHSRFLGIDSHGVLGFGINLLREACIGHNAGIVAEHAHMGAHHGGVARIGIGGKLKVVLVKGNALHQVALGLGFKAGNGVIDECLVLFQVLCFNGHEEVVRQADEIGSFRRHDCEVPALPLLWSVRNENKCLLFA